MSREYRSAVRYIEDIPRFTTKNTPQVTRTYLDLLGAPDRQMNIVHVAGTNGKGSVSTYLAHIFAAAGISAGLFTSPHLVSTRERMVVDGQEISEEEFLWAYRQVKGVIGMEDLPHPTYFEFLFLMAMVWFSETRPKWVILETGLGGRLDATNTVARKRLCVITRIGMDHMQYLGNTIGEIAAEKAGILRSGVPAVVQAEPAEALEVFRARARELCCPLQVVDPHDFSCREVLSQEGRGIDFLYRCRYHGLTGTQNFHCRLHSPALYQGQNAALAAAAALWLSEMGTAITPEQIEQGLEQTRWPGRMEEFARGCWMDGAHNEDGIRAFLQCCAQLYPAKGGERILLFSAVQDKAYARELQMIEESHLFSVLITAPMKSGRSVSGEVLDELAERAQRRGDLRHVECADVSDALGKLMELKRPQDLAFAAGSLYLVGEIRSILTGQEQD